MTFSTIETTGFVRVSSMPDLSYSGPVLGIGEGWISLSRTEIGRQGIYKAGAAVRLIAVSAAWILNSISVRAHSSITCTGTGIADVSDPEHDKDGIGVNAIGHLTLTVTVRKRATFDVDAIIGEPTFGGGIRHAEGRALRAAFEVDREALREALLKARY